MKLFPASPSHLLNSASHVQELPKESSLPSPLSRIPFQVPEEQFILEVLSFCQINDQSGLFLLWGGAGWGKALLNPLEKALGYVAFEKRPPEPTAQTELQTEA